MTVYIQIGTNNGNDNFRKLVIQNKPDLVILVEPNSQLINLIQENYRDIQNVYIINKALYYQDDIDISLYIPETDEFNKAKNGCNYSDAHYSLVPMNDWGQTLQSITTKSIRFNTLCEIFNINKIDYLQIDTEGFDSEIIKMIDFTKYKIYKIRYEKWLFDKDCFDLHNKEISDKLGKNGMKIIEDILTKNNYTLYDINDDDGNDIIAILNS